MNSQASIWRKLFFMFVVLPPYLLLFLFIRFFELVVVLFTKNGRVTFFPVEDFPWTAEVRRRTPEMREELDALLENLDDVPNFQDIQVEQRELTTDNKWKTYVFYAYGVRAERTCRECPKTAEVVGSIPNMVTAMFSILSDNKRLPPHRGPYKGVLCYHLGLKVPEDYRECGIRVSQEIRHWEEGKDLIFDDTHEHEAWNNTSSVRVVLFVDVVRPLPFPLAQLNSTFIWMISKSPFIRDAKNRFDDWYETVEERRIARQAARQNGAHPQPP